MEACAQRIWGRSIRGPRRARFVLGRGGREGRGAGSSSAGTVPPNPVSRHLDRCVSLSKSTTRAGTRHAILDAPRSSFPPFTGISFYCFFRFERIASRKRSARRACADRSISISIVVRSAHVACVEHLQAQHERLELVRVEIGVLAKSRRG